MRKKKNDCNLIKKIKDWITDIDNLPIITYSIGLGCGCLIGHIFGEVSQAAKDVK